MKAIPVDSAYACLASRGRLRTQWLAPAWFRDCLEFPVNPRTDMAHDTDIELRAFVDAWRSASERLEDLRRRDLRNVDVADRIEALNGAFEATLAGPPRTSSGLVEQQAVFARMKHAGSVPAGG